MNIVRTVSSLPLKSMYTTEGHLIWTSVHPPTPRIMVSSLRRLGGGRSDNPNPFNLTGQNDAQSYLGFDSRWCCFQYGIQGVGGGGWVVVAWGLGRLENQQENGGSGRDWGPVANAHLPAIRLIRAGKAKRTHLAFVFIGGQTARGLRLWPHRDTGVRFYFVPQSGPLSSHPPRPRPERVPLPPPLPKPFLHCWTRYLSFILGDFISPSFLW